MILIHLFTKEWRILISISYLTVAHDDIHVIDVSLQRAKTPYNKGLVYETKVQRQVLFPNL